MEIMVFSFWNVLNEDTEEYGTAIIEKANQMYGESWNAFLETIIVM